jgi:hypothetical protein
MNLCLSSDTIKITAVVIVLILIGLFVTMTTFLILMYNALNTSGENRSGVQVLTMAGRDGRDGEDGAPGPRGARGPVGPAGSGSGNNVAVSYLEVGLDMFI